MRNIPQDQCLQLAVQLCFVTDVELDKTAHMCGAIVIKLLTGHANTVRFDIRHCALHVDAHAFSNQYIQIDVLIGLRAQVGGRREVRLLREISITAHSH